MVKWKIKSRNHLSGKGQNEAGRAERMLTGEEKNKVDQIWETFWTGGITNPATVIEQFTYLLFLRQLDEVETKQEGRARLLGLPYTQPIFSTENQKYRWHKLRNMEPEALFSLMRGQEKSGEKIGVFEFLRNLHPDGESAYARYMTDAAFAIQTPKVLVSVMDGIDGLELGSEDSKGDLYEYLLSKLSTSGTNGQFRTPRHIIQMMVELAAPTLEDRIVDPAMGSAGFLVAAQSYLRKHYGEQLLRPENLARFHTEMFHGFDTDATMLRIGAMNMLLHGVKSPDIDYRDSLSKANTDKDCYTLCLANPPFKGSLDKESVEPSLLALTSKATKTELLFLALFLRILAVGGRAAVIVPAGVLFGSSKGHKAIRKALVDDNKLTAVISMPSGVFKPYAGVSTAILLFTKTGVGGTDSVWFYDMHADGFSLDDKRSPIPESDIPDILARFHHLEQEKGRQRTEQSFLVPAEEIRQNGYDLSFNKYKEIEYVPVAYPPTEELLGELDALEGEISQGLKDLRALLAK